MRLIVRLLILIVVVVAAGLWFTRPETDDAALLSGVTPDVEHGEWVFTAAGCASCHMAEEATGEDKLVLTGGQPLASPFGTFYAPNISSDPEVGIGDWDAIDLWNALHHGTGPGRRHLYPALPYTAYVHMTPQDVVDLHAYLATLPADPTPSKPHEVPFPFNMRVALGGWKLLFLDDDWAMQGDLSDELLRGREIVEAMGHCAECHTPRNALGGLQGGPDWMTGGANPSGRGSYPNLVALDWSDSELIEYFTSGFTPEFDSAGGHMALVVENLSSLPEADRAAVAAYINALPLN